MSIRYRSLLARHTKCVCLSLWPGFRGFFVYDMTMASFTTLACVWSSRLGHFCMYFCHKYFIQNMYILYKTSQIDCNILSHSFLSSLTCILHNKKRPVFLIQCICLTGWFPRKNRRREASKLPWESQTHTYVWMVACLHAHMHTVRIASQAPWDLYMHICMYVEIACKSPWCFPRFALSIQHLHANMPMVTMPCVPLKGWKVCM